MEYLSKGFSYIESILFPKILYYDDIMKLDEPQKSIEIAKAVELVREYKEEAKKKNEES